MEIDAKKKIDETLMAMIKGNDKKKRWGLRCVSNALFFGDESEIENEFLTFLNENNVALKTIDCLSVEKGDKINFETLFNELEKENAVLYLKNFGRVGNQTREHLSLLYKDAGLGLFLKNEHRIQYRGAVAITDEAKKDYIPLSTYDLNNFLFILKAKE